MLIKYLLNGKEIALTSDNVTIKSTNFNVDKDGNMSCKNGNFNGSITSNNVNITGGTINMIGNDSIPTITINDYMGNSIEMYPSNFYMTYDYAGQSVSQFLQKMGYYIVNNSTNESTTVAYYGIETPKLTQTSLESQKKNFEKLEKGLDIVKATHIYKYNFKSENDNDKKHIGLVIGKNYKYSKEITALNKEKEEIGVDLYSMIAVAYKAIQEQQEQIQNLQERLVKSEQEVKNGKDNI